MSELQFCAGGKVFPLTRTYVMGILNVTPDSFSDGGKYLDPERALARALEMKGEGADIIDIGGQSTRPGYTPVSPEEEWRRIGALLPAVARDTGLAVSVDTFYPWVAEKALAAGAHIINDVSGFGPEMMRAVSGSRCGCIVMHPGDERPGDILPRVREFFQTRLEAAQKAGISPEELCFDPGIGFGKTMEENLRLIAGASRKRVTGFLCGNPPFEQRLPATLAAHTAAVLAGADLVRVHDVKEAVQAARMADGLKGAYFG